MSACPGSVDQPQPLGRGSPLTTMHRRVLLPIAVAGLATFTRLAHAQLIPPAAPPGRRTADQKQKLAALLPRMHALAALRPLTPEAAIAALGTSFGPPKQIKADRRQWRMQPSELFAGGMILQAGATVVVTVAPSPALDAVFEDFAASLLDRPYHLSPVKQDYKGAPRVWVIEHVFQVAAGQLRLQTFPSIPPDDPRQVAKAEAEGTTVMLGKAARPARVMSFSVSSLTPTRAPSEMTPLGQRRKRARAARP